MLNTSLIYLSLKYINKNYKLISKISKWIYSELTKFNYKESKFIDSLINEDFEIIEILIESNKDIDLLSRLLLRCCTFYENTYFRILKLLINNGAYICIQNHYLLRWASLNGHFNIVKLLIENGTDIHTQDDYALRWASYNGYFEVVKLLIDNGANVHALDDHALKWASGGGHFDITKLLIENGAIVDNDMLKYAKYRGYKDIVKLLIENGADESSLTISN